ncbi:entericidin A/B family lipoprotein [Haloferula chungangensis]|uniref:Entericidin A/B family lipoprotein n=1 Tax=Haloferula chungangensis TaxID=1048331 RepID=A0ABW2L4J9_9BACT
MKKNFIRLALLAFAGSCIISSCNTTKGFGEDLQKVGGKIEKQADETGGTD